MAWSPGTPTPCPPTRRAHLGQPCLGIQDTQEAVRLVYQEVQAGLLRGLGDGHPGQQLPPTLLLGTASTWFVETTRVHGGPHLSQSRADPPIVQMSKLRLGRTETAYSKGLWGRALSAVLSLSARNGLCSRKQLGLPGLLQARPAPPPGPAAAGCTTAADARCPGCCTAAPDR